MADQRAPGDPGEPVVLPPIVVTPSDTPKVGTGTEAGAAAKAVSDFPPTIGVGGTNEAKGSFVIVIGGDKYDNVLQFRLTVSKEATTGVGQFVLSWPGAEDLNLTQGGGATPGGASEVFKECAKGAVYLDGQLARVFRLWSRTSQGTPTSFRLTVQFRGLASDLVDSVPYHESGQENNKTPKQIMEKVMEGFDSKVIDFAHFQRKIKRMVFGGETADRIMRRATRPYGLQYYETPEGNLALRGYDDKEGSGQALTLGKNFTEWSVTREIVVQFRDIMVEGSDQPDVGNGKYGKQAEEIAGKATNGKVGCQRRIVVRTDTEMDPDTLKKHSEMESDRRSMQGVFVTLKLSTWSDDSGKLWSINKTHHVKIPIDQIDNDLLVTSVQFDLAREERTTTMILTLDPEAPGSGGGVPNNPYTKDVKSEPDTGSGSAAP